MNVLSFAANRLWHKPILKEWVYPNVSNIYRCVVNNIFSSDSSAHQYLFLKIRLNLVNLQGKGPSLVHTISWALQGSVIRANWNTIRKITGSTNGKNEY